MDLRLTTVLPVIGEGGVDGRSVIIRADLEADAATDPRFVATHSLVQFLLRQKAGAVKVVGHGGGVWLVEELGVTVNYNIRSDPREEQNSVEFAAELADGFDVYINEAFGVSHRLHTSIDALPRWMKKQGREVYCGPRFTQEVDILSQVLTRPGRKILVIGGAKVKDKERLAQLLEGKFDVVLKGGLLPGAELRPDGLDIPETAIGRFKAEISQAAVVVTAGTMGKFEDTEAQAGTREILTAIASSPGYKVAGGGDTEAAIAKYHLIDKFDWISVGGGAMLEFLATGTLPGIEALVS